jgi:hypothetical protein
MVVLGADLHKRSHTIVVIDATGRQLAEKTIVATDEGHLELRRWAAQWPDRTWGLEDCRHLSRRHIGTRRISRGPHDSSSRRVYTGLSTTFCIFSFLFGS